MQKIGPLSESYAAITGWKNSSSTNHYCGFLSTAFLANEETGMVKQHKVIHHKISPCVLIIFHSQLKIMLYYKHKNNVKYLKR